MDPAVVAHQIQAHDPSGEDALAALEDLVEHRRGVGDRAADHAQHFARSLLLLERLPDLVEQPHVLDRDDRLVGESFQQFELPFGYRTGLAPARRDRAEHLIAAQHRHGDRAAPAARLREPARIARIGEYVLHLHDRPRGDRARGGAALIQRPRVVLHQQFHQRGRQVVLGDEMHPLAVMAEQTDEHGVAKARGVTCNGIEHRLRISLRLRDHLQHFRRRGLLLQRFPRLIE